MNALELLRANKVASAGINSAQSSFQGRRLARATDAGLARRVSRLSLAPVAVAEITSDTDAIAARGKSYISSPFRSRNFKICVSTAVMINLSL